jgi:hypothetical protein
VAVGVAVPLGLVVSVALLDKVTELDCVALEVGNWLCVWDAPGVAAWLGDWLCDGVDDGLKVEPCVPEVDGEAVDTCVPVEEGDAVEGCDDVAEVVLLGEGVSDGVGLWDSTCEGVAV